MKPINFKKMFKTNPVSKNPPHLKLTARKKASSSQFSFPKTLKLRMNKGFKDWDKDGVMNLMDCKPFNKHKQDFSLEAGMPIVDSPKSFGYKRELKYMSPDEYMEKAYQSHGSQMKTGMTLKNYELTSVTQHRVPHRVSKNSNVSQEDFDKYRKDKEENTMNSIKAGLHLKEGVVPTPYLETKAGVLTDQEGRHRAVAAREFGYQKIPVYMVETDKNYLFNKELTNIIKYYEQNPRGSNQGNCHNAVKAIAKVFLKHHRSTPYSMQVYQIQTAGPDGKPSNHVVLKVGGMFYDPTGIQYTHIHGGNHQSRTENLPSYYKVFKVAEVRPYL